MQGRLERIEPGATYEGHAYTQYVRVTFEDGTELELLDYWKLAEEGMLGRRVEVEASATLVGAVERAGEDAEFEVEPYPDEQGPGIARMVTRVAFVDDDRIGLELFDGVLVTDTFESADTLAPGDAVRCTDVTELLLEDVSTL